MNDFEYCKEIGERYQDILQHELLKIGITLQCHSSKLFQLQYGESMGGIECKHDSKIVETGNIYFEFSAINKKGDEFVNNGITKQDNAWLYVIGNGKECWLFSKKQLLSLYNKVKKQPQTYREKGIYLSVHTDKDTQTITSQGMCIRLDYCEYLCLKHLKFERDYTEWLM